jgi:glycosyltransferase involved in cell wall biosynthesis
MLIYLGPLTTNARQGGVTVLTDILLEFIKHKNIDVISINTNKHNKLLKLLLCGEILLKLLRSPDGSKVLMNVTFRDVLLLLPFVILSARLKSHIVYLRKFAGDFHTRIEKLPYLLRMLTYRLLDSCVVVYVETPEIRDALSKKLNNIKIFPNVRRSPDVALWKQAPRTNKLVFCSQVRPEKGILGLIAYFKTRSDLTLDIYGVIINKTINPDNLPDNVRYMGVLPHTLVSERLIEYDALLLPTRYESEGYPGIIIEASLVGLPVITRRHMSIPTMCGNNVTYIGNEDEALSLAIDKVFSNLADSRDQALNLGYRFEAGMVHEDILKEILRENCDT